MNTKSLLNSAEFALAAYATLNASILATQTTALKNAGLSGPQADRFASSYTAVLPTFHDDVSDFDVNVFKDIDGQLTVAIRGTLGLHDLLVTDADIVATGVAYDQIVAMYNWWLRVSTATGQVAQFQYTNGQL